MLSIIFQVSLPQHHRYVDRTAMPSQGIQTPCLFRTLFGKLQLDSPRLYHCVCCKETHRSFSLTAELREDVLLWKNSFLERPRGFVTLPREQWSIPRTPIPDTSTGKSVRRISGVYETTGRGAHPAGKVGRRGKVQPCSRAWRLRQVAPSDDTALPRARRTALSPN
jgi:hypothetical protein